MAAGNEGNSFPTSKGQLLRTIMLMANITYFSAHNLRQAIFKYHPMKTCDYVIPKQLYGCLITI